VAVEEDKRHGQKTVLLPKRGAPDALASTVFGHGASPDTEIQSGIPSFVPTPPVTGNRTIGRFELIREIARGGMGQVFLGRDTKLGRRVAIKFMLRADAHWVQRFLVEARATARCTHENIVTIFEVGEHDGLPYMVLEYLEGRTLSDLIDESRPSVRQFAELMVPVVRALERAHEHGIVHRDLKPSNIFVTDRGHVKVLDFGVARLVEPTQNAIERMSVAMQAVDIDDIGITFTGSDSMVGTLPFMSPEQWGAGEVDHQSDIWSVGIMFWRALIGVHPAGSMVPEVLRAVLLDLDTPMPSIARRDPEFPRALADIVDKCLQKRKEDRYQTASELLADLQAFLAPRATRASAAGESSPYRGLVAYSETDAQYFFGRSSEIRTALAQLDAWPLLVVVGPSGVGKSSFVHAGLVPAVRDDRGAWRVNVLRPGRQPLQRLAAILEDTLESGEVGGNFVERLVEGPGLFGSMLRDACAYENRRRLVVIDQLEELFTLCDNDETRRTFLAALLSAVDDPSSPVRVVMSMRADFLDRLASYGQYHSEIAKGLCFLAAPDRENLRETLVRPAELAGYAFEDPWIVDDMLQAANSRGALPLLSFAAMRLWEARDRQRKLLTVSAYNEMGGVGGAFAKHADQVAASVPNLKLFRAVVTRLVTPEGTRAVVDLDELLSLSKERGEVERILEQLERGRLIQKHAEPDQPATVEIVHEMLITEWPTLHRWLEDSHALRAFLHELRQAAKQWASRGKPADLVWRGATAQDALAHAKRHVLELAQIEREFLDAIASQSSRTRRRRVFAIASIFVALGLVIAAGSIALVSIQAAKREATEKAEALSKALEQTRQAEHAKAQAVIAADDATKAQSQTKEQLVIANRILEQKLRELEAAHTKARDEELKAKQEEQRARFEESKAKKATEEAKAATKKVEELLEVKRRELEALQKRMKDIIDVDLRRGKL
jgi:hypothetical protein